MTVKENETHIQRLEKLFEKLSSIVLGNGTRGMDEIVRDIEKRLGVLESDFAHFKRVYFSREGLDAQGNPPEKTQPKGWWEKTWERVANNLFDKFITAVIIVILLNIPQIIEWFLKQF